jgi:hypothetical protein
VAVGRVVTTEDRGTPMRSGCRARVTTGDEIRVLLVDGCHGSMNTVPLRGRRDAYETRCFRTRKVTEAGRWDALTNFPGHILQHRNIERLLRDDHCTSSFSVSRNLATICSVVNLLAVATIYSIPTLSIGSKRRWGRSRDRWTYRNTKPGDSGSRASTVNSLDPVL